MKTSLNTATIKFAPGKQTIVLPIDAKIVNAQPTDTAVEITYTGIEESLTTFTFEAIPNWYTHHPFNAECLGTITIDTESLSFYLL